MPLPKVVRPSTRRLCVASLPASIVPSKSVARCAQCMPSDQQVEPTSYRCDSKDSAGAVPTCLRPRAFSHSSHGRSAVRPSELRLDPFVSPAVQTPVRLRPQPPNLRRLVGHLVHTSDLAGSTTHRCPEKRSAPNRIHHHRCASGAEPATSGRCPDRRTATDRHTRFHPPCGSCQRFLRAIREGRSTGTSFRSVQPCGRCVQPSNLCESGQNRQISRVSNRETGRARTPSIFPPPPDTLSSRPIAGESRKGDVD